MQRYTTMYFYHTRCKRQWRNQKFQFPLSSLSHPSSVLPSSPPLPSLKSRTP